MKPFLSALKIASLLTVVFAVLLGGVYPLVVWAGAQAFFSRQANGSLITEPNGTVRGSALLAQHFSSETQFHPRPSAAGTGYDASSSSGTNLGPTSRKLADSIQSRVTAYRAINGLAADAVVPADAVTSSASGLDPHISPANAHLQAARVALARGVPIEQVRDLISQHTAGHTLGFLGDAGVNVLNLNRALDAPSRR